tara:strand:- start:61 stop:777 length:717 start_codon:yes stop_codon:yes gene_type:complete
MILGLIPARLKSKRLKNKLLLNLNNMPLIIHTLKNASQSKKLNKLFVCTDSKKIFDIVKKNNGLPIMTSKKYTNGTERIASVARKSKAKLVIDIQGDEVFVDPRSIDKVINFHLKNYNTDIIIGSCRTNRVFDKSIVKLIFNKNGNIYDMTREDKYSKFRPRDLFKQVDIISFKPEKLIKFSKLKQSKNEINRKIELMRALDNNFTIKTVILKTDSFSINTKKDFDEAKKKINEKIIK